MSSSGARARRDLAVDLLVGQADVEGVRRAAAARRRSGCARRAPAPSRRTRTPGRDSLRSTRWVPRLGSSEIPSTSWPAHTPVALIDRPGASIVRDSPVQLVAEQGAVSAEGSTHPGSACARGRRWRRRCGRRRGPGGRRPRAGRPRTGCRRAGRRGGRPGPGRSVSVRADPAGAGEGLARGCGRRSRSRSPAPIAAPGEPAPGRPADARGERDHHRQRADEVRGGGLHQDAALDGALVGDVELALGQVAQPAVDQLGAPPAGAPGEVERVDRDHVEAAAGGVEGDAGAGDAEPDDEQVGALGQPGRCRRDLAGGRLMAAGSRWTRRPSSSSKSLTSACGDAPASVIVVRREGEAVARPAGAMRASSVGSPSRISLAALALRGSVGEQRERPAPGSGRGGRAGRAAAARGRRR